MSRSKPSSIRGPSPYTADRQRRGLLASDPLAQPPDRYLTAGEVADRLGLHVKTVLRYVRVAELPVCRLPGGDLRFAWPEVLEWLNARRDV